VCEAALRQSGVQLETGSRAGAITVAADADRLCQVFINLLINAIRYNDAPAPVLRVQSSILAGSYAVEIADNGPGVPTEERKLIFEKFSRGKRSPADTRGAGLGLAISRQLVERMNGTLELVEGPLCGACFRVQLPLRA
jgi:signal transduction histidine kinase